MSTQCPLPKATALRAVTPLLRRQPSDAGTRSNPLASGERRRVVRFADGTAARVYRETAVAATSSEPCFLAVSFRLRGIRGRGHALFRRESILNTPLFVVGFPGFVSKLWLAHDDQGAYRGLYEWDGAEQAEHYARSLWRVLELVGKRGSIDYRVVPGLRRDDVLAKPAPLVRHAPADEADWWRVMAA